MVIKYRVILVCLCLFDLAMTAVGLKLGHLEEVNPIMGGYLIEYGIAGLIFAKLFLFAVPVFGLETVYHFYPKYRQRVRGAYKIAVALYVFIFGIAMVFQFS